MLGRVWVPVLERSLPKQPHFLEVIFILSRNSSSDHMLCEMRIWQQAGPLGRGFLEASHQVFLRLLAPQSKVPPKGFLLAKGDPHTLLC